LCDALGAVLGEQRIQARRERAQDNSEIKMDLEKRLQEREREVSQLRERVAALEARVETLLLLVPSQRSDGVSKSVSARLVELRTSGS
jgi:hypothetical protein